MYILPHELFRFRVRVSTNPYTYHSLNIRRLGLGLMEGKQKNNSLLAGLFSHLIIVWSRYGKAVPPETMLCDILLMKRHNINAVRTSHYPQVGVE